MPADNVPAGTGSGAAPQAAPSEATPERTPPRKPAEIVRDIEAERAGLTDAVASLRHEIDATRAKILSKRTLAIVAGSVVTLFALRRRLRRR